MNRHSKRELHDNFRKPGNRRFMGISVPMASDAKAKRDSR